MTDTHIDMQAAAVSAASHLQRKSPHAVALEVYVRDLILALSEQCDEQGADFDAILSEVVDFRLGIPSA